MSSPEQDGLLGRIAVHNKLITMDQLVEATMRQELGDGTKRLGDVLVEMGFISAAQLQKILQAQKEYAARRQAAAGTTPASPAGAPSRPAAPARPASIPVSGAAPPAPSAAPGSRPAAAVAAARGARRLDAILAKAVEVRASDVHLHSGAPIKMRVNGKLADQSPAPLTAGEAEAILLEALEDEQRSWFLEHGEIDLAYTVPGVARFRSNIYRQQRGTDGAFRLIPPQPPSLEDLGLPTSLAKLTHYHQGLVLVTGPAGCGKSSTMAALLNIINEERRDHIISIEDPIEYLHPAKRCAVNQRQVMRHTASFARALRAALREDPDIIAIGELRDLESISLALTAAETGHLVLATLHTNNTTRTINRLLGVFPPNQQPQIRAMISESLRAIVSQRLIPTADGTRRVPALEVLINNKAAGSLIRDNKTFQIRSVLQTGAAQGMCLLDNSLSELVKSGVISKEEALRNCEEPKRFGGTAA
jgi:twitching motility protein PilT